MTANTSKEDLVEARRVGMNVIMAKPLNKENLIGLSRALQRTWCLAPS